LRKIPIEIVSEPPLKANTAFDQGINALARIGLVRQQPIDCLLL
jgi:hypothetical protein